MDEVDLTVASKAISRVLRYRPGAPGVALDAHGWCPVAVLSEGLACGGVVLSRAQLEEIVPTRDKQRFALSDDGLCIRANQGYSVGGVNLQLREKTPPSRLFHGSVAANLPGIGKKGCCR